MTSQPEPSPPNADKDLVTQFREAYGAALHAAHAAAELTATPAWQDLYLRRYDEDRKARRAIADAMRELADTLDTRTLVDDELKIAGALRKRVKDTSRTLAAFVDNAVEEVVAPVRECAKIAEKFYNQASAEEDRHPLHQAGLLELMRKAIAEYARPEFNEGTGVVTIVEA